MHENTELKIWHAFKSFFLTFGVFWNFTMMAVQMFWWKYPIPGVLSFFEAGSFAFRVYMTFWVGRMVHKLFTMPKLQHF